MAVMIVIMTVCIIKVLMVFVAVYWLSPLILQSDFSLQLGFFAWNLLLFVF